jgi:Zn-dependent M28 family amino/carboxypeptidase
MNDNASGGIALLEVALKLAAGDYPVNNAIKFSWWSAQEQGLLGSKHYVNEWLTEGQRQMIRLYLNFDMLASPAGEHAIYTSDHTQMGLKAPVPGMKEAEQLFRDYFDGAGLAHTTINLKDSSDHWPFALAGIPTGGLYAGADPNSHTKNDTLENMNQDVFLEHTKAIAHAVSTYAESLDSLPPRAPSQALK